MASGGGALSWQRTGATKKGKGGKGGKGGRGRGRGRGGGRGRGKKEFLPENYERTRGNHA